MRSRRLLQVIFIMTISGFGSELHAQEYLYSSAARPRDIGLSIDINERSAEIRIQELGLVDSKIPAFLCGPIDDYVCIWSEKIRFAKPRKNASGEWNFRGVNFELLGEARIQVAGISLCGVTIVSYDDDFISDVFIYSEERGLLAFSLATKLGREVFLSEALQGYGAESK